MLPEVVLDADQLYRRLQPDAISAGAVVSVAFKKNGKPDDEISVDLARLTTPQTVLRERPDFGLGMIVAGYPRSIGFAVLHDPQPENIAHSLIKGENSKTRCRLLAEQTIVLINPRRPIVS